jgi:hypothetical protein
MAAKVFKNLAFEKFRNSVFRYFELKNSEFLTAGKSK